MTRLSAPARQARQPQSFTLLAVALATAALVSACGGGDATAPDTVPPTVAITSSAAGTTASGAVTFTFTFSEDVGTSFTAEDLVVSGGTAGSLTKVSATQYTLVVTPAASSSGTLSVAVAAAKFSDIAKNANTASAALDQAYSTVVASSGGSTGTCTAAPCISFSSATVKLQAFGALGAEVVADPVDASNKVGKLTKVAASETWAGATFDPAGDTSNLVPAVDLATNKVVTLRVYSPAVGEVVMLKLENSGDSGVVLEKRVNTTKANAWETLSFDFAAPTAGTYNAAKAYDRVSVFPHFDTKVTADTVFYIDELKYAAVAASSGGGTTTSTALVSFDEATAPGLIDFGTNGAGPAIVADPAGGSNKVLKVFKYTGSEQWAGTTVATVNVNAAGAPNAGFNAIQKIPFSASAKTMTLRVYSPAVGVRIRLKVENANDGGVSAETDALTTKANAWETLTFDFANPGKSPPVTGGPTAALNVAQTYNKVSIFADFGLGNGGTGPLPADRVYYFDDLSFGGAAASGGTGGSTGGSTGTAAVQTFSAGFSTGGRTAQGGEFGGFSGSNLDNFGCSGAPAFCGGGGDTTGGAASGFYYYYQTPSPATGLYAGIYILAPGVTGGLSGSADTAGISIAGQTTMKFNFGQNPEWFASATKNFMVQLDLGKLYTVGGSACHLQLRKVITPTAAAASAYSVPLSSFAVVQNCAVAGLTTAAALAASPISQVSFQAAGGSAKVTDGVLETGANLSVSTGSPVVYPTTLVVNGAVTFE